MIVHHPRTLIGGVDLGSSVGDAEIRGIHTLSNELLGQLCLEIQKRSGVICGERHSNVHFRRWVGTDIDSVSLLRVQEKVRDPPHPITRQMHNNHVSALLASFLALLIVLPS